MSQARMVQIEQDILSKNNAYAAANRQWFDERGIFALNLVSSPGSGKTTLLCKTIELLKGSVAINVVEGDQQTANDAERIRATGVPALQINTGKGCHLDGHMVGHAMQRLQPKDESLFLIENVGNLVCPAAFDLGEHHKVAILSVTEGEDKPLKYPDMFAAADVMLLNKCDLLPYLEFDADLAEANARRVNPNLTIFRVSATSGDGMSAWLDWIQSGLEALRGKRSESVDALKRRVAELERQLAANNPDRPLAPRPGLFRASAFGLRLATGQRTGLTGWVRNDGAGVAIAIAGDNAAIFVERLPWRPRLARIDAIDASRPRCLAMASSSWRANRVRSKPPSGRTRRSVRSASPTSATRPTAAGATPLPPAPIAGRVTR
jgi:hydrogenase accessory protein HypB